MRRPAFPQGLAALAAGLAVLATNAAPARAALTPAELARVRAAPAPDAAAPLDLAFRDGAGAPRTLRQAAGGEPLVLIFADYGCTTLCGPALAIAGARLAESGLRPGKDYRLAVVPLDPRSTPTQAQAFGRARLPGPVLRASSLLTGDAAAIAATARALGYGYVWDAEARNFAHPVAAYVLQADGRPAAVLSEVALTAPAFRRAVEAAQDRRPQSLVEQVALVCHGVLAAAGRFDGGVLAALRVGGGLTVVLGVAAFVALVRKRRRPA